MMKSLYAKLTQKYELSQWIRHTNYYPNPLLTLTLI